MNSNFLRYSIGLVLFSVAMILISTGSINAATVPTGFTDSTVVTGLTNPTAMAFAPDGRIFVCEQGGRLRVIKNGVLLPTPFVTLTVDSAGERGLLGIAFDPNFVLINWSTSITPFRPQLTIVSAALSRLATSRSPAVKRSEWSCRT